MTFTPEQTALLKAPLNKAHVKPPAPGKYGEYIEGWRVIDEANRIFGFDGWTRETIDMIETNRDLKGDKWHVGYRSKVRIEAHGVVREGSAFGSGVSKQIGDAIESAVKEAETDAMKRALMTFGNPFGLALYDKTKANVAAEVVDVPMLTDEQLASIDALSKASGVSVQTICETANVSSLPELTEARAEGIIRKLNLTIQQAAAKAADQRKAA